MIVLRNVTHTYETGSSRVKVLTDASLNVARGESCAIVGESGSGKSTLLHILGLLDRPQTGYFELNGYDVGSASLDQLAHIRNREIGFVFQSFNLLSHLSSLDNVALPLFYRGVDREAARRTALTQLRRVGLADRVRHVPADLSGGQRQRVAIARALVGDPSLLLADEPTGNLDSSSATAILNLLLELNQQTGLTLIIVTHDESIARRCSRRIEVRDGMLWDTPQ